MAASRKFMFDVDFSAEITMAKPKPMLKNSENNEGVDYDEEAGDFGFGLDDDALEELKVDDGGLTTEEAAALKEMNEAPDHDVNMDMGLGITDISDLEPPPSFSEDDMKDARQSAYEEGYKTGVETTLKTIESQTAMALDLVVKGLDNLFKIQEDNQQDNLRDAVQVAMAVIRKVFPASFENFAETEIAHTVGEVIGQILDEPRVIVRVAPQLEAVLKSSLDQVVAERGFEGRVVVQPDARIVTGDCRIEWTDGGAERDQTRLLKEIEELVEKSLATVKASKLVEPEKVVVKNDEPPVVAVAEQDSREEDKILS